MNKIECDCCYYFEAMKHEKNVILLPRCNTIKKAWVNPAVKNQKFNCEDFKKLSWLKKIKRWILLH